MAVFKSLGSKQRWTDRSFLGTVKTLDTQSVGSVTGVFLSGTILSSSFFVASFLGTGTLHVGGGGGGGGTTG